MSLAIEQGRPESVGGFPKPERTIRGAPEALRVLRGKPGGCCAEESTGAGEIVGAGED